MQYTLYKFTTYVKGVKYTTVIVARHLADALRYMPDVDSYTEELEELTTIQQTGCIVHKPLPPNRGCDDHYPLFILLLPIIVILLAALYAAIQVVVRSL